MKRKTTMLLPALAGLAALLLTHAASAEMVKAYEGRKLFNTYCFLCHGIDGKGSGPLASSLKEKPKNLVANAKLREMSLREMSKAIKGNGAHGGINEMPQWGRVLSEPQIESIASYVLFLQRSKTPLRGDPELGRATYERYCVACHGMGGTGNGVMTKVLPIKPTDHTSKAMAELTDRDLIAVIAEGSKEEKYMPGWKGVLTADEIDGLVSYIRLLSSGN